jgi:hypothetical protein
MSAALDVKVVAAVLDGDVEHLRRAVTAVLEMHGEHKVRDRAGEHLYSICANCCMEESNDTQSPSCRDDHEHFGVLSGRCWPCSTWWSVAHALRVKAPELGLM